MKVECVQLEIRKMHKQTPLRFWQLKNCLALLSWSIPKDVPVGNELWKFTILGSSFGYSPVSFQLSPPWLRSSSSLTILKCKLQENRDFWFTAYPNTTKSTLKIIDALSLLAGLVYVELKLSWLLGSLLSYPRVVYTIIFLMLLTYTSFKKNWIFIFICTGSWLQHVGCLVAPCCGRLLTAACGI